jgi:alanyl-tRNA synthetase
MRVSGKHNDLDNVGPSLRHHTFFEMLGNFSFGDYFKKDAIRFAWELLTGVWGMPPDKLVPSIFKGDRGIPRDEEAYELWKQYVPADRILELGVDDNFWQMGDTGPCGRCSEIYYVRGSGSDPEIEIWNNVSWSSNGAPTCTLTDLPASSIDTGMASSASRRCCSGRTPTTTPICSRRYSPSSHDSPGARIPAATAPKTFQ